ncbi:hypothetical protein [Methanolapillus millepedarum]|uniref:hypothetical protein n=1 Tax=Methanolapillus millepedarum TaxID=3028296 RepID=UPI0030B89E63
MAQKEWDVAVRLNFQEWGQMIMSDLSKLSTERILELKNSRTRRIAEMKKQDPCGWSSQNRIRSYEDHIKSYDEELARRGVV